MPYLDTTPTTRWRLTPVFLLVIVIVGGGAGWLWLRGKNLPTPRSTPAANSVAAASEAQAVVGRVGQLIVLPTNETPTVGTITDAATLAKTEPFFKGVINGDRILLYQQAQKAFLYSPARGILLNVGPIVADPSLLHSTTIVSAVAPVPATSSAPAVSATPLTLVVRNGSRTPGRALQISGTLSQEPKRYSVLATEAAARKDYAGTTLILLDQKQKIVAEALAKKLSAKMVATIPTGEKLVSAEALLIIGN